MDTKQRLQQLKTLISTYQNSYYKTGKSEVTDLEYDRLFDELLSIESKFPELVTSDSPSRRVGSDLTQDFPEVSHTIPVLSLDKAYSTEAIYSFIKRMKSESGEDSLTLVLEEKIDGFSIVLYYENGILVRAVTRGNGFVGNDVTDNVKTVRTVPLRLTENVSIAVRGEIFLPVSEFERINSELDEPFANPRNLASGTIRRIKSSDVSKVPLSVFCYEGFMSENSEKHFSNHLEILRYLIKLGFNVDPNICVFSDRPDSGDFSGFQVYGLDKIPDVINQKTQSRADLPYEIDGLVLKVNNLGLREKLGFTEHHPRWALAYKFQPPQAEAKILNIDVQVGRTGRITPMARISPVVISGSEIKNATLHNQDYIDQLELCIGDTVAVSKRGDVIPAVEYVTEKNSEGNTVWHIPENCPVCNYKLVHEGAHLFCPNKKCAAREMGALVYFCAKKQMDIQGMGEKMVKMLYEKNYIRKITDIYSFSPYRLLEDKEKGVGEKKIKALDQAIQQSIKQSYPRLLAALGIEEFSHNAIDLLIKAGINGYEGLSELVKNRERAFEFLSSINGLGPEISQKIINAFNDPEIIEEMEFFKSHGFNMEYVQEENAVPHDNSVFSGQVWCVTGSFEKFESRELIHDIIRSYGGKTVTSVSGNTTHLLVGEKAGSKLNKALSLGVKTVSEQEFLKQLSDAGMKVD